MHRVAAKFVPRLLTEEQKQNRVTVSQELLDRSNTDENFLKKCHNRWWNVGVRLRCWNKSVVVAVGGKILATTKKSTSESFKCEGDVDSFFFYWKAIVHNEFVPCVETVNKEFYLKVMKRWREAVRRKRPEVWTNKTWMVHRDNAPAHASLLIREFLVKQETIVVPQPPTLQIWPLRTFSCSQSWSLP